MKELTFKETEMVQGGIVPLVLAAGKAFGAGFALGAAAYGLYFSAK